MTNDNDDLSAGINTTTDLSEGLLKSQRQKATFRNFSFYSAWGMSLSFFVSVIIFSWSIIFCPNVLVGAEGLHLKTTQQEPLSNAQSQVANKKNTHTSQKEGDSDKEVNKTSITISLLNQFLILLALLSAIGTTLAIAVMRYSFYEESENKRESESSLVSPVASSISNFINQIVDLLKK